MARTYNSSYFSVGLLARHGFGGGSGTTLGGGVLLSSPLAAAAVQSVLFHTAAAKDGWSTTSSPTIYSSHLLLWHYCLCLLFGIRHSTPSSRPTGPTPTPAVFFPSPTSQTRCSSVVLCTKLNKSELPLLLYYFHGRKYMSNLFWQRHLKV